MTRLTAKDFSPELLELYDFYAHGRITRREFLDRAGTYTAAGVTAAAALDMLKPDYALAQQVSFTDPDIVAEYVTYPSPNGHGEVRGYPGPAGKGPYPAVVVVHENRGLNPYIEDVARRLGKAGFMALAPDGLTSVGGYPGNDDRRARTAVAGRSRKAPQRLLRRLRASARPRDSTGKVGCVGFCYGGGVCNAMAVAYPELAASVPFYGRQAAAADVPRIEAPLLLHYAELDERINAGWPAYEAALQEHGKDYTVHFYEGVNHGFHNDSTPRYDEAAAELAWERTIAFFNEHLR
jgi:carboxymethylenebutenolidase